MEAEHARAAGVTIGSEMHPGMVVYNPETFMRLRGAVGDVAGCNFDPSHLFWQGIDVVEAALEIARAGALVHVHAKDTALDAANVTFDAGCSARSPRSATTARSRSSTKTG